jgi:dCMP deaminase
VQDCIALGCLRDEMKIPSGQRHEVCRAIHAEQNAIIQAGLHGINIKDSIIYCTHSPCILCAKMLVNAGIVRFVSCTDYADPSFKNLFKEAGIDFVKRPMPVSEIQILE